MNEPTKSGEPEFIALVNCPKREELFKKIAARWESGQGFALATLNLDHIVKIRQQSTFRSAYEAQSHVVADGNPIVWLSRLAGKPVELIPGSELIEPISGLAAQNEVPVALLGANEETLDKAAGRLESLNSELKIVCKIAPPYGLDPMGPEVEVYLEKLRTSGAKLCFLALGAPKQEILAARGLNLVPGCGFVSIGAGLDFLAGSQKRAPIWLRKLALEWLWRMLSDPGRLFARYANCILILPGLTWRALWIRWSRRWGLGD